MSHLWQVYFLVTMATLTKKGTKVRHKTKGMVETVIGLCKVKYMGAWVDGVIYEGNDTNTGELMTFVRVKEDFENNFEVL